MENYGFHKPKIVVRFYDPAPSALTANLQKLNLKFQTKCVELCRRDGIGILIRLRTEVLWVRVPPAVPSIGAVYVSIGRINLTSMHAVELGPLEN